MVLNAYRVTENHFLTGCQIRRPWQGLITVVGLKKNLLQTKDWFTKEPECLNASKMRAF